MIPREDNLPKEDMQILNHASRHLGKPLAGTPYKGITINEAFAFIGYPDVKIDVRG